MKSGGREKSCLHKAPALWTVFFLFVKGLSLILVATHKHTTRGGLCTGGILLAMTAMILVSLPQITVATGARNLQLGFGRNMLFDEPSLTPTSHPYKLHTPNSSLPFMPTPPQPGFTPVIHNAEWTPLEQDFDGVMMMLVPAGCFDMGSNEIDNEKPIHEQCFDAPFWMDKYEVTQSQFVALGGSKANANSFTGDDRPVERITWFEARDYCENNRPGEVRLPTEREWEYAARGPDNLVYPWGNEWDANKVIVSSNQPEDVGNRPTGVSWVGALDMSGNVWEWMSTIYQSYPYKGDNEREDNIDVKSERVLRGGGWNSADISYIRTSIRGRLNPDNGNSNWGFRCVRSF